MSDTNDPSDVEAVVRCERCDVEEHYPILMEAVRSAHIKEHPREVRVTIEPRSQ